MEKWTIHFVFHRGRYLSYFSVDSSIYNMAKIAVLRDNCTIIIMKSINKIIVSKA